MVKGLGWFKKKEIKTTGGVTGTIMGVSDIEKSRTLYSEVLGYDTIVYDESGVFEDLAGVPGGKKKYRRVLLRESKPRVGAFSKLFGPTEIELIQNLDKNGPKVKFVTSFKLKLEFDSFN